MPREAQNRPMPTDRDARADALLADAARLQIGRVAAARGLDPAQVRARVDAHTQAPTFGMLGATRVDVLALNLALDAADATRGAE